MKKLILILCALTLLAACGRKADLKTPPAPGEVPAQETPAGEAPDSDGDD